jgi:DNA-binding transcriptional regulator LsrR (DeoR family)
MLNPTEHKLLVKVAKLYYLEELTQAEIAKKLGVSRPIISKMLQKARSEGIVEIKVHDETFSSVDLERRIESAYGLDEVIVVQTRGLSKDMVLPAFGKECAAYLGKVSRDVRSIGVGWGVTLYHIVNEFPVEHGRDVTVIPLVGGMGTRRVELHSNHIAYELAKKMGGKSESLYAPAIVESADLKEQLVALPHIKSVLEQGYQVEIALIGLGTPYRLSTMREIGYLNDEDIEALRVSGAVGDINSRFIDAEGNAVKIPLNDKVIGTDLEHMKQIPKVIGAAIGVHKAESMIAAMRGGYVSVLITDEATAEAIVRKTKP